MIPICEALECSLTGFDKTIAEVHFRAELKMDFNHAKRGTR